MNVKNKKIIRKLTFRTLKARRARNIVAVIAIALTATLFTTVFAIGGNIIASMQEATMRMVGTSAHAGLKYLTQEQYDNFKESPLIKDISYTRLISVAENEALKKKQTEIRYGEDDAVRWMFSYPAAGRMPRDEYDIVCSTITLDMLGIPHELGQKIPLEFTAGGRKYAEEFDLCGYYPGDSVMMATQVFLSKEYADRVAPVPETVDIAAMTFEALLGTINADMWFGNSMDIEGKVNALIEERGYAPGEINTGINWAYAGGSDSVDVTSMLVLAFLVLLILFSGYLIIYSVFTISVTGDILFYGLLKTIGATGKQLRRVVRGQALLLSALGIPLGFAAGYAMGYLLTPFAISVTIVESPPVSSVNPLIFVFSALFSLLTVFISCRKPGRIAAKVSPVEAVRYTEPASGGKNKRLKKTRRVTPLSMAVSNSLRNKRKLAVIVLSLSLSVIILNSVHSMVNGFDMDLYLKDKVISDFLVSDYSVLSPLSVQDNYNGVDENIRAEIANLNGLENMSDIYLYENYNHKLSDKARTNADAILDEYAAALSEDNPYMAAPLEMFRKTGEAQAHIYGVGEYALDTVEGLSTGYAKLSSGDYIIATEYTSENGLDVKSFYEVGDKVPLVNADGELREFEVIDVVKAFPYPISAQHTHPIDCEMIIAEEQFKDFYGGSDALGGSLTDASLTDGDALDANSTDGGMPSAGLNPMMSIFNVADAEIENVEAWLKNYCESINPNLDFRSRSFFVDEFESFRNMFAVMGGALSFILGMIGVLNFINATFTSVTARRQELAMLQSIGMTGTQLKQTLFFEGTVYAALTVLFSLTAGSAISYLVINGIAGQTWFFTWNFSLTPVIISIPVMIAVCAAVPLLCYGFMRKESIVERLRIE